MADPWTQFAEAPAEHPAAPQGDFAQFAPSMPNGASYAAYIGELQRRFDAGQPLDQLRSFIHDNGADPNAVDFDTLAAKRAAGDRVRFVQDGSVQVTPNDGSAGGVAHDASVAGTSFVQGGVDALSQLETMATPQGMARAAANAVLERFGYHLPSAGDLLRQGTQALDVGTPHSQGERYLAAGAAGLGSGLASGGRNVAGVALNALSGTASGVAGQAAAESGFGAVGQTVASLAAGLGVNGLAAAARHLPLPRRAAAIAETVPHEVAVDPAGNLTAEGHELALRAEVPDEEVAMAYARARRSGAGGSHQAARETARNRDRSLDQPLPDNVPVSRAPEPDTSLPGRTTALVNGIRERVENGGGGTGGSGGEPPAPPRDLFTEAREEGIPLTRGQAEQSFPVQNDENSLRVSSSKEGVQAQQWFAQQQQHIQDAVSRFRARFGPDAGNAADRGEQVQQAVRDLRDAGAEGIRALYRQAEELGGEGLRLNTRGIHDAATDVLIDEAVPEPVKRAISQELARYGIIGTAEPTNEAGITRVTLDDGSTVSFRGPIKQLTAANAEDLRRAVNRLYDPTKPNLTGQSIKPAIDQALEEGLSSAADGTGPVSGAYREARAAYQGQRRTFHAKDIIQSLHANKKGTNTPVLLPERAIAQVIGAGANGVTNLRTTKALLLSSGTDSARQAWAAIQHQGIADLFGTALRRDVPTAGGIADVFSGAKLNSAIETFGVDKLRILLSPEDFNGLMKLRRIIGAATIPIGGTINPSGTATKILNFMRMGLLRPLGLGKMGDLAAGLVSKAKDLAATQRTLAGITNYTGPASAAAHDRAAQAFMRDFIDSGTSGALVPATVTLNQPEARR